MRSIPPWVHRATRRRQLLSLGVSLDEQQRFTIRELDEILAVEGIYAEVKEEAQKRESSKANRRRVARQ